MRACRACHRHAFCEKTALSSELLGAAWNAALARSLTPAPGFGLPLEPRPCAEWVGGLPAEGALGGGVTGVR